jgi:hypothetical protein
MQQLKFLNLLMAIFGLYVAIRFRYHGKKAIEDRKAINKFLGSPYPDQDFGPYAIWIAQIMALVIGTILFISGLIKFLS